MGFSLHSMVSRVVWSPQWEQSMSMPTLFMRSTAFRPNAVSPPVALLLEAVPQGVGLGVCDAQGPHAEAEEEVNAVHVVLDHGRALHGRHQRDLPLVMRPLDVRDPEAVGHEVLMGQVAQAHPEIVEHVVPLPPGVGVDAADAVHEVVEDAVPVRRRKPLEGRGHAPVARVLRRLGDVVGEYAQVLVEGNEHRRFRERLHPRLFIGAQGYEVRLHTVHLAGQVEGFVVHVRLEVRERRVAAIRLVQAHVWSGNGMGQRANGGSWGGRPPPQAVPGVRGSRHLAPHGTPSYPRGRLQARFGFHPDAS